MRFLSATAFAAWVLSCGGADGGFEAPLATVEGAAVECKPLGATVSGVAFTDAQATNVVLLADQGSSAQLDAFPYIGPTTAAAILAGRPYGSDAAPLAKLDGVSGIGVQVLTSLRDNVDKLWCSVGTCCDSGVPVTPTGGDVRINEFSPGSSGWIEVYNGGTSPVSLAGWKVDDIANAGAAPKNVPAGTVVPAKGLMVVAYGGVNTSSIDAVRLLDGAGAAVDQHDNFWHGGSLAGKCFGRQPDGGAWSDNALPCTKGETNAPPPVNPQAAKPVINEFLPGSLGWVEIYNPTYDSIPLAGWAIDDIAGAGAAPKVFGADTLLNGKDFMTIQFGGLNTSSVDEVRLLDASGKVVDSRSNGWSGTSVAGKCVGRLPDAGDWAPSALICTPQGPNQGNVVVGAPKLILTEIQPGPGGWFELYNPGTSPVPLAGLWVKVASVPYYQQELQVVLNFETAIPPKAYRMVPVGITNTQADVMTVVFVQSPGAAFVTVDSAPNFYAGSAVPQGTCYSRVPVDGPWWGAPLKCSPGSDNTTPGACTPGAKCNDGNPCMLNETFTSTCTCGGGKADMCDDSNVCTLDQCSKELGCSHVNYPAGTPCGTGMECNFGNCTPIATGTCQATGGTYKTVTFTKEEECKALDMMNRAPSSAFNFTDSLIKLVYDCTPAGVCGYHAGKWTSLEQITVNIGSCVTSAGQQTLTALKLLSATWTDPGLWYDTVANVWTNRAALVGRLVTLENVWVEKKAQTGGEACWQIRDNPGAPNYITVCYAPNCFGDGCYGTCDGDCLDSFIGQRRWIRGTLKKDSYYTGGYKLQMPTGVSCGAGVVHQAPNPTVNP